MAFTANCFFAGAEYSSAKRPAAFPFPVSAQNQLRVFLHETAAHNFPSAR